MVRKFDMDGYKLMVKIYIYIIIESWVSIWWLSPPKRHDIRWRNLACRHVPSMCRTTGGSHVDRGHRWEENV